MVDYKKLGTEIGELVQNKQQAYGDSFGKSGIILRSLYPDGVKPAQYDDMLAVVRIIDKLFRIATDRDALGENPFRDICGYGLLGTARTVVEEPVVEGPITLYFTIEGEDVSVKVDTDEPLATARDMVLKQHGELSCGWQIRDDLVLLPPDEKIKSFNFTNNYRLVLELDLS
jgi:hypothetical protein